MKKIILLILSPVYVFCQTDSTEIKLTHFKDLFTKGLISAEEYANLRTGILGIKDIPQTLTTIVVQTKPDTLTYDQQVEANKMFRMGQSDANTYFKTGGVFGGTFCATVFVSPLIGLIPAIACSNSRPKEENFINKDAQLFKNPDYMRGYKQSAAKQKRSSAWAAWGAGFGIDVIAGIAIGLVERGKK